MTRERLAELATAALGPRWQRALARRLINPQTGKPMNERTVRRYASGELRSIPDFVESKLQELREERLESLQRAGKSPTLIPEANSGRSE